MSEKIKPWVGEMIDGIVTVRDGDGIMQYTGDRLHARLHFTRVLKQASDLTAENARLREVVDKLPKTKDGVAVVPRVTRVFYVTDIAQEILTGIVNMVDVGETLSNYPKVRFWPDKKTWHRQWADLRNCYSTLQAAEQAKERDDDE